MSSVDKRRRERIRTKKVQQRAENAALQSIPKSIGGHVTVTPGRTARRLRKSQKITKASFVEAVKADTQPFFEPETHEGSLRKRRSTRRLERLRREGIDPRRPEARVRQRGVVIPFSWRWLSGTLSIALLLTMYGMVASNVFIVNSIGVGPLRYLAPEEVYEIADVSNTHLFWIDAQDIEARLEANPSIADAQVFIGWPPNMVSIQIIERDPVLVWVQSNFPVWVDINGTVMFQRQDRPELVRVVYPEGQGILGVGDQVDRDIIAGALQLKAKFPTIEVLLYDDIKGLGYRDTRQGNSWVVWFGTGTQMEMKVLVYNEIVRANYPRIIFKEVDVSDHDHPTFTKLYPDQ